MAETKEVARRELEALPVAAKKTGFERVNALTLGEVVTDILSSAP
jgi:hypothetical protein